MLPCTNPAFASQTHTHRLQHRHIIRFESTQSAAFNLSVVTDPLLYSQPSIPGHDLAWDPVFIYPLRPTLPLASYP